jgi:hypothetical protein
LGLFSLPAGRQALLLLFWGKGRGFFQGRSSGDHFKNKVWQDRDQKIFAESIILVFFKGPSKNIFPNLKSPPQSVDKHL